jgi:hypothetical protein
MTAHADDILEVLESRTQRRDQRRAFFKTAIGAAAVGAAGFTFASAAQAQTVTDTDVLNFALNLEYLEANFYSYAVFGTAIDAGLTGGTGNAGAATGGRAVTFTDPVVAKYAREIAQDEIAHVAFLRRALTSAAVAQPVIDVGIDPNGAFSNAARAAGLISGSTSFFDPYADDESFLLGAFIFEDVGVTAYKGASPLISNADYLEAAAGILAVEAYHAAIVRTTLYAKGMTTPSLRTSADAISNARDSLDGSTDLDQGISPTTTTSGTVSNIVPLDSDGIAYSRSTGQVLNIVYLNKAQVSMGGFFPNGVNGSIKSSANNA